MRKILSIFFVYIFVITTFAIVQQRYERGGDRAQTKNQYDYF